MIEQEGRGRGVKSPVGVGQKKTARLLLPGAAALGSAPPGGDEDLVAVPQPSPGPALGAVPIQGARGGPKPLRARPVAPRGGRGGGD